MRCFLPIKKTVVLATALVATTLAVGRLSADSPWASPVNLSSSGSASQPAIAVNDDGTLHVLWWDAFEGTLYARANVLTDALPMAPTAVYQIVGDRKLDQKTGEVTALAAPRDVRLVAGAGSSAYALWFTLDGQLMAAQTGDVGWSPAMTLTTSALALDVTRDVSGRLRLAYVRGGAGGGIYYQVAGAAGWSAPVAVSTSPYLRVVKPDAAHVSVAAAADGQVLVVWDDPLTDQSLLSRSSDNGKTWSAPSAVIGRSTARVQRARVAAAPNGEFLLMWQDAASGGCGVMQRRSADGGATWSAPERILPTMTRCPTRWQFAPDGKGRLWLVGLSAGDQQNMSQTATLAIWDGGIWSDAVDTGVSFQNPASGRSATLGCLDVALAGERLALVGCDDKGDVWVTTNAVPLEQVIPAASPVWSSVQVLSDGRGPVEIPVAVGADGRLYVMWSQGPGKGETATGLYVNVWDGTRWGRATKVFSTVANPAGIIAGAQLRAEQPALAVDRRGNLHAVWSGGTSGRIMYSWVYGRDALSAAAWAEPVAIPAPSEIGGWPDIVADPRGDVLHLVYAVPYNEQRGVYYSEQLTVNSEQSAVNGQRSTVSGGRWLTPTVVFDAAAAGWESVSKPRLAMDATSNTLHVAWLRSFTPGGTNIQSLYYSRSTDGGQTWSPALKVIEGTIDWPRLIVAGGQVHLLWNRLRSDGSADLWHQYSTDGGGQWSQAGIVRGFDRLSGPVAVAADGAGVLHVLGSGQSLQGNAVLLRGLWDGSTWTRSETLALGQEPAPGNGVGAAVLIVSADKSTPANKGSRLMAVSRQAVLGQDGQMHFAIVATGREVQAVAVTPAPTFTPLPSPTPTVTPMPRATATVVGEFPMPENATAAGDPMAGQLPLLLGGSLALVLVLGAVVTRGLWGVRR